VPRFLLHHPEHSEPAAAALIRLHSQQQACEPSCKHLEDQTRHDALQGLSAVLRAARACRAPNGEAAVKLVLDHLFRCARAVCPACAVLSYVVDDTLLMAGVIHSVAADVSWSSKHAVQCATVLCQVRSTAVMSVSLNSGGVMRWDSFHCALVTIIAVDCSDIMVS
jgi:hypothetical protein